MATIGKRLSAAQQQLCIEGAPFACSTLRLGTQVYRQFSHAPLTMRELLDVARGHGEAEFLCHVDALGNKQRCSFSAFFQRVDALANALVAELNIQQGQRIAIAMRNSPEWLEIYAATVSIGAIVVPLNSWGSAEDLEYVLHDSDPSVLFCDLARLTLVAPLLKDINCRAITVDSANADVDDYLSLISPYCGSPMPAPWPISTDQPVQIMYSSGTSGRPKGVLSSHRNIIQAVLSFECQAMASIMVNPDAMDIIVNGPYPPCALLAVPLFHVSGCYASFLLNLRGGRRIVMMYKWQAGMALELIEQEKVTIFSAAPSMLIDLLQHPNCEREKLASLFSIGSGGASCPDRLRQLIRQYFPQSYPGTGYGMTESNAVGTSCVGLAFVCKAGSVGTLSPLMELKTCDAQGKDLPPGSQGEIYLRSVCNSRQYWRAGETIDLLDGNGWLASGDIGYLDEDGFLFITDRAKDIIIRGGENISPVEIENLVSQHPDILECAVLGLPDDVLGESLALVYRTRPGSIVHETALQEDYFSRLAPFKRPTRIRAVSASLPRNPSGKLLKSELAALFHTQCE